MSQEELALMAKAAGGGVRKIREATLEDLEQLAADFASAAERSRRAGFDAVELHGAHGYIFSEFLSPAWNFREDAYGGPIENRARLLCEVIRASKASAGEDFLVLGADPTDFSPRSEVVSSGSLFFVGGSTGMAPLDPLAGDAAIVALDERDGSEVWRASEGEVDFPESFSVVGAASGHVCAAGTIINSFVGPLEVLVACYRANRGERMWVRRIELAPTLRFESVAGPRLHVSERAVVVTVSTSSIRQFFGRKDWVLRFDARDGTGR